MKPRLYKHQIEGVNWLKGHRSGLLADDPGMGKTAQILQASKGPLLIVCPAVGKGVWASESDKWGDPRKVTILSGRNSFRYPSENEIIVTNYEILNDDPGSPELPFDLALDEAQKIKSPKARMTLRARKLCCAARASGGSSWLLSGTPLLNRPPELYALLESLGVQRVFKTKSQFSYFAGGRLKTLYLSGGKRRKIWDWTGKVDPRLAEIIAPYMLRRRKEDVLDLPGKTRQMIPVKIPAKLENELNDIAYLYRDRLTEGELPPFHDYSRVRHELGLAKLRALNELVDEYEDAQTPLIVMSWHKHLAEDIAKRNGWGLITGETPANERTQVQSDFQDGKLKGVAATIKAASTALTLHHASNMVFAESSFVPADMLQAEDRIYRIGQKNRCTYRYLVADCALERKIHQILMKKQRLINEIIEKSV